MRMKKIQFLFFIISGLVSCNSDQTADSEVEWVVKQSGKYSVSYPENWSFNALNSGVEFTIISPLDRAPADAFSENVNLLVENIGETTMEAYIEASIGQLEKLNVADLKHKNNTTFQVLEYLTDYNGNKLKVLQHLRIREGKVYILTFTDLIEAYSSHRKEAEKILKSFELSD